ncbi:MAG: DNA glycosylase [Firmicutes bacterium]|nr:DNA glycosylase [Bacillota bacterium]
MMMEKKLVNFQVKDFHLDHIFDCGQCFRWNRGPDGSYLGIAGGRVARMHFEPSISEGTTQKSTGKILTTEGILTMEGCTEADFHDFWYDYLDLGRDYSKIKQSLGRGDAAMRRAIRAGAGIRILKQDLWETMVSFIISQNNNIPRIKGCIEALCREFGEPVPVPDGLLDSEPDHDTIRQNSAFFDIPSPERLAALNRSDMDGCRRGYRAPYLIETARQVLEMGGVEAVRRKLSEAGDCMAMLEDFAGVGPKVASCIALFGVGRTDAFPIDVWMRRAMLTVYGIEENRVREMQEYAAKYFGQYGGLAQQYLFYYIRGL